MSVSETKALDHLLSDIERCQCSEIPPIFCPVHAPPGRAGVCPTASRNGARPVDDDDFPEREVPSGYQRDESVEDLERDLL